MSLRWCSTSVILLVTIGVSLILGLSGTADAASYRLARDDKHSGDLLLAQVPHIPDFPERGGPPMKFKGCDKQTSEELNRLYTKSRILLVDYYDRLQAAKHERIEANKALQEGMDATKRWVGVIEDTDQPDPKEAVKEISLSTIEVAAEQVGSHFVARAVPIIEAVDLVGGIVLVTAEATSSLQNNRVHHESAANEFHQAQWDIEERKRIDVFIDNLMKQCDKGGRKRKKGAWNTPEHEEGPRYTVAVALGARKEEGESVQGPGTVGPTAPQLQVVGQAADSHVALARTFRTCQGLMEKARAQVEEAQGILVAAYTGKDGSSARIPDQFHAKFSSALQSIAVAMTRFRGIAPMIQEQDKIYTRLE